MYKYFVVKNGRSDLGVYTICKSRKKIKKRSFVKIDRKGYITPVENISDTFDSLSLVIPDINADKFIKNFIFKIARN